MEIIELDLDNENEMTFNVVIEGTRPGEPLCRLMIENEDMSFSMQGDFLSNNEVAIVIPPLKGILKEGKYDSYLEVLVDDRVFIPLEMKINFEESIKVVAESKFQKKKKRLNASASLVKTKTRNNTANIKKEFVSEAIEENNIPVSVHPAKRRRDERTKKLTDTDILKMISKVKSKKNK